MERKIASGTMLTLLLIGMLTLAFDIQTVMVVGATPWDGVPDDPTPAQAIWVDPKNTTCLDIGDEFVVNVLVNITDPDPTASPPDGLYGFQYWLFWNSTVLEALEIQTHFDNVPTGDLPPGWTSVFIADNTTGVWNVTGPKYGLDYHEYAVCATGKGDKGFTGVDSLCTYKFKVKWQPEEPLPDFCGLLDIYDGLLVDDTATVIPSVIVDGMYCVKSKVYPPPKLEVDPHYVMGVYGENFTVDIIIAPYYYPLSASKDMCSWQGDLYYDTTMLDALECTEGPFMPGFAGPDGTYPICNINDTAGVIHMADMFLGPHTAPSGSGVLMTIKFNATWMYTVPPGIPPVICVLDLYDVLMGDCASNPIELFGVNDGEYEAPYKLLPLVPKFLTLPLRDSDIKIQQGWIYTFDPDPDAHKGIDYIKGTIDEPDTWQSFDVVAATDGVAMQSSGGGYGRFVYIQHDEKDSAGNNYFTLYAHLSRGAAGIVSKPRGNTEYSTWTPVKRGEFIGRAGDTGSPGLIHLHFEVQRGGYPLGKTDPYDLYKTRDFYPGGSNYAGCGPNHLWTTDPPTPPPIPADDIYWLAKAIMSEASVGTQKEQIAVGWTVLNRLDSGRFGDSIENVVKGGYAYNQEPTEEIRALAKDILERKVQDPTEGAMFFFSPRSMPKEGDDTTGFDVGGGLHQVPYDGQDKKVWFPSWAKPETGTEITEYTTRYLTAEKMPRKLEWRNLTGIRNWYFMFYRPFTKQIQARGGSPVELRVIDSEGRVTGLVNGTVVIEIPGSDYFENTVTIFFPNDTYRYVMAGITQGLYGLTVTAVTRQENITFSAIDIPTSAEAIHQYTIDWAALSLREEGVTVQTDSDGDGTFEQTATADNELTRDEFLLQSADLNDDRTVNIVDGVIIGVAFGSRPGDPNWNPIADLNGDNFINIVDIVIWAMHFGETW